jgi:hypothetical protein
MMVMMIMMIIIIMSMGWDYASELRAPSGLLLVLQVIYEHGKPWRNDIDMEKLLIRLLELSGNHTNVVI